MPIDWDNQPLGLVSDTQLARELGVNKSSVRRARGVRGIKAYTPNSFLDGTTPTTERSTRHPDTSEFIEPERIAIDDVSEPVEEQPIEELIAHRVKSSQRKISKANKHKKSLTLPAEPVGLCVWGDPHVDNSGCDWKSIVELVELLQQTEGVLNSCVGDMHDNWIGRLARIYADADCTASDGWRLSEWLLNQLQWIAIVGGNHDAWAHGPGIDPYEWLAKRCRVTCYAPDEIRITLHWKNRPDLEPIVWVLRHDFKGRSWFHPTHGPAKEAMLDGRAHVYTAGHIHSWGQLSTEQRHGRVTHALRIRGFKRNDKYAREKGFDEQQHGAACLLVIDPEREEPGRITVFWDIEAGCAHLTRLRADRARAIAS